MLGTTANNNPKKSQDFDEISKVAIEYGYNVDGKIENGYIYATRFSKNNRYIWQCIDRSLGGLVWQTVDLVEGCYRNHKKFTCLETAFNRPL